jgi:hypothetical protein
MEIATVVDVEPVQPGTLSPSLGRTENQAQASRRNGRKSRGPVTVAGKERSRGNAVTHGLFARVVPAGQLPVFADRREYVPLVQQMQGEFGIRTALGRALVESLALDILRLRYLRSMELAVLDPGLDGDRELETALRDRERASHHRSDEENEALLQTYSIGAAQLRNRVRLVVPDDLVAIMAADLWRDMNEPRQALARDQEELKELDAEIAVADPADVPHLQSIRAITLESIGQDEADMKTRDRALFFVEKEADLTAYVAGRKSIPPAQRERWADLLDRQRAMLEQDISQVRVADARINHCRRRHYRASAGRVAEINGLGEYEDRIRRSMAKTVTMIKEVESRAVIEVPV